MQNYPNPFNSTTMVKYGLAAESPVSITVYDILGRIVRSIDEGTRQPGYYQVIWDGKNANGSSVASGIYFYKIAAGEMTQIKRMLYLK